MSHYIAVAITPPGERIEEACERLLAPYAEQLEVEPYEEECYCVTHGDYEWAGEELARRGFGRSRYEQEREKGRAEHEEQALEAVEIAQAIYSEIEDPWASIVGERIDSIIRQIEVRHEREHHRMPALLSRYSTGVIELERERRKRGDVALDTGLVIPKRLLDLRALDRRYADEWFAFCDESNRVRDEVTKESPGYGEPDADCEECGGSGKCMTTSNPQGYWDWWVIGGRWSNFFGGEGEYDPWEDPRNWERCFVCRGTGIRDDQLGIEKRQDDPEWKCNGCQADPGPPGMSLKHPPDWVQVGNTAPTERWVQLLHGSPLHRDDTIPFAVITPDGEWHTKPGGGFSRNKQDEAAWREQVVALAKAYPNHSAAAVDYHN